MITKTTTQNRARGAVVLVATARDLLSPFSEEVVVGSLEVSTHEFEAASPFLHDHAGVPKLYVRTVYGAVDMFVSPYVASLTRRIPPTLTSCFGDVDTFGHARGSRFVGHQLPTLIT